MPNSFPGEGPGVVSSQCPMCGAAVYVVRPEKGGTFWADEIGEPWTKHGCFDDSVGERVVQLRPTITFGDLITGRASRKPSARGSLAPRVAGLPGRGDVISDQQILKRDLSDLDLSQAAFLNCDFRGSDLSRADLRRAVLLGCDFRDTRLVGANLTYADLRRSDFRNANLRDAQIIRANVRGALGLDERVTKSPSGRRRRRRRPKP